MNDPFACLWQKTEYQFYQTQCGYAWDAETYLAPFTNFNFCPFCGNEIEENQK